MAISKKKRAGRVRYTPKRRKYPPTIFKKIKIERYRVLGYAILPVTWSRSRVKGFLCVEPRETLELGEGVIRSTIHHEGSTIRWKNGEITLRELGKLKEYMRNNPHIFEKIH